MLISLVIPTYNEAARIASLIEYLLQSKGSCRLEVLVIDGGSTDTTVLEVERAGAKVLKALEKGRAAQMNYGATHAKGEIIYFVHADTRPPRYYDEHIIKAVADGKESGCFTSIFDWDHPFLRFCNYFSRLPFWFCRGGGQTLFVTKSLFINAGGFDEGMKLMEEYDFISRARKLTRFAIIRKNAITSARDYRLNGAVKLQLIYSYIFFLYAIGAPQEKLLSVVKKHVNKA